MANYEVSGAPKGALLTNESRHNFTDPNRGGGPTTRNAKRVPAAQRGGVGHSGQRNVRARMGRGKAPSGNPASRPQGRIGSFFPETRVPGHGGPPQRKGGQPVASRGGFGHHGQSNLPSYSHGRPSPGAGNTSGRSYRLIAGRFKRAAMGARPTGGESAGSYGSPPVSSNT